jgi:hypothetical protein
MAMLIPFFGTHGDDLKIYVARFPIGAGKFQSFSDFEITFIGSYTAFFQVHPLSLAIKLTDQDPNASSGPCIMTVNDNVDRSATYNTNNRKITFKTRLAQTSIDVYRSQGGTQVDGLDGHNAWIG